ncbi:toprim domain-containing protein [Psychrobacter celer]|uniref:toprim domain-containing protein n=1 Tax=Psychrobacter celer TaxID=306572 RepID=UPI003FD1F3E0
MSTQTMSNETRDELIPRLIQDYALKLSSDRQFLRYGRCPSCGKKELFTGADSPWTIQCGRANKCGYQASTRDIYPDIFANWTERNPPTPTNPNATADAYLQSGRGFDIVKWQGSYSQEVYKDYQSNFTCPTVRFNITSEGQTIGHWERLIEPAQGIAKAKVQTGFKFKGYAWLPPKLHLQHGVWSYVKELWIVEGIFDAMALTENGLHAISNITAGNFPAHTLAQIRTRMTELGKPLPKLVIALDSDTAGRKATDKLIATARQNGWDVAAAQSSEYSDGADWNDLHKAGKLTKSDLERYRFYGALLIADTAKDKALLTYNQYGSTSFYMFFNHCTYWVKVDTENFDKAKQMDADSEPTEDLFNTEEELKEALQLWHDDLMQSCMSVTQIMNCEPQALYYQSNLVTDESWYFFRIRTPQGDTKNTFTGSQLSAAGEFKKRLLSVAPGVIYQGNSKQLDIMLGRMINGIKTVETIDFIGYSKDHQTYIFNDTAIRHGVTYALNKDDYFDLPNNKSLKTLAASPNINIATRPSQPVNWIADIISGWGVQGVISLVGFMGSLFAQQIRDRQKSFPFLEIVGEPGTGKSTLLSFFWRLIGRDSYEGIDPNKTTKAGRLRSLSQTSNMPSVFIESDRDGAGTGRNSQFNWDELKNLYDGGTIGTRGVKSAGNEVYEPPFRGTIVISQNLPVVASKAVLSRICHLFFTVERQTRDSEAAARRIEALQTEDISHFLADMLKLEDKFLQTFFDTKMQHENWLKDSGIKAFRVAHCHAQLLALFEAMKLVLPDLQRLDGAFKQEVFEMATERDQTLDTEHPLNIQFFDVLERLNAAPNEIEGANHHIRRLHINHSKDQRLLAISMSEIYQLANEYRYDLPPQADMHNALRQSKQFKFVAANKVVASKITGRSIRCWVFEQSGQQALT